MKIPKAITNILDDSFKVEYLGKHEGYDAFHAYIPDACTGFPFVFLCEGEMLCKEINGFDALDIVTKFVKE